MREVCYKTYRISSNPIEDITVKMANQLDNVGLTSWEAGFFLAEFVTSNPKLFNQKNVLELGSGIGVTGVVLCKKTNPSIVVLSDFTDPVISNLNQNLSLNGIETVDIEEPKEEQKNQVSVIELDWEKFDFKSGFYGKKIDILLVADCVYDFELIDALTAVLHRFLEPSEGSREKVDDIFSCSPCAFVATAIRIPKTFDYFLSRLKEAKIVHVDVSPPAFGFNMDSVFKYDNSGLVLSYLYRVE